MKKIEAMSEPQPQIPAEELERIEKAALIVYPVRMGTVGDCRKEYDLNEEYREDWTNGAKAEHCHLRERIEELEKEKEYWKDAFYTTGIQIDNAQQEIVELKERVKDLTTQPNNG